MFFANAAIMFLIILIVIIFNLYLPKEITIDDIGNGFEISHRNIIHISVSEDKIYVLTFHKNSNFTHKLSIVNINMRKFEATFTFSYSLFDRSENFPQILGIFNEISHYPVIVTEILSLGRTSILNYHLINSKIVKTYGSMIHLPDQSCYVDPNHPVVFFLEQDKIPYVKRILDRASVSGTFSEEYIHGSGLLESIDSDPDKFPFRYHSKLGFTLSNNRVIHIIHSNKPILINESTVSKIFILKTDGRNHSIEKLNHEPFFWSTGNDNYVRYYDGDNFYNEKISDIQNLEIIGVEVKSGSLIYKGIDSYNRTVVRVIDGNYLMRTFNWSLATQNYASLGTKQAIFTIVMIRALYHNLSLSLIPNELLFEIFSFL